MDRELIVRPYRGEEARYVADAHERVYLEEYNWGPAFGDYAKKVALDFDAAAKKPREELWIAQLGARPVGCIMLVETENPEVGQIRLFLVEKECRKCGVGTKLTEALLEKARACGYRKLVLWTADTLAAARRHYGNMGFVCTERIRNTSWSLSGDPVYEEKWEMPLEAPQA